MRFDRPRNMNLEAILFHLFIFQPFDSGGKEDEQSESTF